MTNPNPNPNVVMRIRLFLEEVVQELKRSAWPTRKELIDSTVLVMAMMVVLGVFVALADMIFVKIVGLLTGAS